MSIVEAAGIRRDRAGADRRRWRRPDGVDPRPADRRLDPSLLGLCLDTGHFRFGGADPRQAVADYHELIRHVHIKDCRTKVTDDVKAEGKGLEEALSRGVFCQLGLGDSGIDSVIEALRRHDYGGWLVIEQDRS